MSDEREGQLGEIIDRRVQVYGDPVETFARIAQVWSGIIGHEIQPWEVPLMMAGMKMVRADVMPDYSDNSDDIAGYLDIFRKIIGEDMIHARTVNEFIEKKWPAEQPIPFMLVDNGDNTGIDSQGEQTIRVCTAHGIPLGMCATCLGWVERLQHLRRAETVTDE